MVDTTTLSVEAVDGPWATGWSELYFVAGEAVLWRADDLGGTTSLGAAAGIRQNVDTGVVFTSSGADLYDKHTGELLVHVDDATSAAVSDPVVTVFTETSSAAWTGTKLLTSPTRTTARSNLGWVLFDQLYRRDTNVAVEVTGNIILVTDDDRYIEHDFDHVSVGNGDGTLVEKCRVPDNYLYNLLGFGNFYACFNDVFDIDGNRIVTMDNGAQVVIEHADGASFLVQEREGSDVFSSRFHFRFANGSLLTRPTERVHVHHLGPDGDLLVVDEIVDQRRRLTAFIDGSSSRFIRRHGSPRVVFADRNAGGVLIAADTEGVSVLDYANTKLEKNVPLTGLPREATFAAGQLVLLDVDGALSTRSLFTDDVVVLDAGPFDALAVHGRLIVSTVTSGARAGLYTFALAD